MRMSFRKPKDIALELVPRSLDGILAEAKQSLATFPFVTSVNVPEIRRLPIKYRERRISFRRTLATALWRARKKLFRTRGREFEEASRFRFELLKKP